MDKNEIKFLLTSFFSWRIALFVIVFFFSLLLVNQESFLGGGLTNYTKHPVFWSLANFDGEHYLAIAKDGYRPLSYFFFPVYPLLMRLFGFFSKNPTHLALSGYLISHVSFFISLIGLVKIAKLDFRKVAIKKLLLLILLFPTSFYFAGVYTESLFLALVVWSFYFAREKEWLLAGILGGISTATRIVGLALLPALLVEAFLQRKKGEKTFPYLSLLLIPSGLIFYMLFLQRTTGNYLEFFTSLGSVFGEQRSTALILFPQVFYRYLFKILPNINYAYLPQVFTTYLEVISGSLFLVLAFLSFYKTRVSYAIFAALAYLIPTFSGSFSSFPRYALVIFPAFFVLEMYLEKLPQLLQVTLFAILFICLTLAVGLFARGYWVS